MKSNEKISERRHASNKDALHIWLVYVTSGVKRAALPKKRNITLYFPPPHTVLIKGFLCTRGRLCSALSAQHFQSAPIFVFQADLLALGQIISLTSFPWKVRSVSDSAQVTSGNTRNRKGGMGERTTLNLIAGGKIKYSTAYTMHLPYLIKAGCLSDNASC